MSFALLLVSCVAEVPKEYQPGSRLSVKVFDSEEAAPEVFEGGASLQKLLAAGGKNAIVEAAETVSEGVYAVDVQLVRKDWEAYAKPAFLKHVPVEWLQLAASDAPRPGKRPKPSKAEDSDDADPDQPGPFYELKAPKSGVIVVFWDTETTGLNVWKENVIQIGAAARLYTGGKWSRLAETGTTGKKVEADEFMRYIKTDKPLPPVIVELTGIDDETLQREGGEFPEVYGDFKQWLEGMKDLAPGKPLWMVAHNGKAYDTKILFANEKRRAHKTAGAIFLEAGVSGLVDSLMISRYFYKLNGGEGRGCHKLGALYEAAFGESFEAHSALEDSRALARLMTAEPFSTAFAEFPLACSLETLMADFNKPREPKAGNDNLGAFLNRYQTLTQDLVVM